MPRGLSTLPSLLISHNVRCPFTGTPLFPRPRSTSPRLVASCLLVYFRMIKNLFGWYSFPSFSVGCAGYPETSEESSILNVRCVNKRSVLVPVFGTAVVKYYSSEPRLTISCSLSMERPEFKLVWYRLSCIVPNYSDEWLILSSLDTAFIQDTWMFVQPQPHWDHRLNHCKYNLITTKEYSALRFFGEGEREMGFWGIWKTFWHHGHKYE